MTGITGLLSASAAFVPSVFPSAIPVFPITPRAPIAPARSVSGSSASLAGSTSSSSPSDSVPFHPPNQPYTPSRGIPFALPGPENPESNTGLTTTRDLIEALFNPVPSTSTQPSPFTYFDPAAAADAEAERAARAAAEAEAEQRSADTRSEDASEDGPQNGSQQGHGRGRHWWRVPRRQRTAQPSPTPLADPPQVVRAPLPEARTVSGGFVRIASPLPMGGGVDIRIAKA